MSRVYLWEFLIDETNKSMSLGFIREGSTPKAGYIPSGKTYGCNAKTQTDEESFMERITGSVP